MSSLSLTPPIIKTNTRGTTKVGLRSTTPRLDTANDAVTNENEICELLLVLLFTVSRAYIFLYHSDSAGSFVGFKYRDQLKILCGQQQKG